jgi:hypothetical protein
MSHHAHINPPPHPRPLVERWLLEPERPGRDGLAFLGRVLSILQHAAPILAGVLLAAAAVVLLVRFLAAHRPVDGARLVTVGVPPEVEPAGGLLLWQALHDLLRPRWARQHHEP